jgi:hypothetical protein
MVDETVVGLVGISKNQYSLVVGVIERAFALGIIPNTTNAIHNTVAKIFIFFIFTLLYIYLAKSYVYK